MTEEIRELICRALVDFAFIKKIEMPKSVLGRYVNALDGLSQERLEQAFEVVFRESVFLPMPAEIRAIAEKLPLSPEAIARAEAKLMKQIAWGPKRIPAATTPLYLQDSIPAEVVIPAPEKPQPRQLTEGEYKERMAELERQKQELLRIDAWGKEVTKYAKPIERGVLGGELENAS